MNWDDLIDLAARVEALEGPDREVDAEIALSIGIVRERDGNSFYGHRDYSVMVLERGYYDIEGSAPELPSYTASLDAALMLVPEGWNWMAGNRNQPTARAYVENGKPAFIDSAMRRHPERRWHEVVASTPALALTAASLRAIAEGMER